VRLWACVTDVQCGRGVYTTVLGMVRVRAKVRVRGLDAYECEVRQCVCVCTRIWRGMLACGV